MLQDDRNQNFQWMSYLSVQVMSCLLLLVCPCESIWTQQQKEQPQQTKVETLFAQSQAFLLWHKANILATIKGELLY